jgi:type II secretory pathway pseudopilin PulG
MMLMMSLLAAGIAPLQLLFHQRAHQALEAMQLAAAIQGEENQLSRQIYQSCSQ